MNPIVGLWLAQIEWQAGHGLQRIGLLVDEEKGSLSAICGKTPLAPPPALALAPCLPRSCLADRGQHTPPQRLAAHAQTRRASGRSRPGTLAVCLVRS